MPGDPHDDDISSSITPEPDEPDRPAEKSNGDEEARESDEDAVYGPYGLRMS
jgi:hypothetical protein